jgi:hypothetical protein
VPLFYRPGGLGKINENLMIFHHFSLERSAMINSSQRKKEDTSFSVSTSCLWRKEYETNLSKTSAVAQRNLFSHLYALVQLAPAASASPKLDFCQPG